MLKNNGRWISVRRKEMPLETPLYMKDRNGEIFIGMLHSIGRVRGVVPLTKKGRSFKWDGKSWKFGITHWRKLK